MTPSAYGSPVSPPPSMLPAYTIPPGTTNTVVPPAPLPPDPGQIARDAAINAGLGHTLNDIDYTRGSTTTRFGLANSYVDSNGNTVSTTPDPYSLAEQLKRSFENAKRAATNSYAARGQLYSGAQQGAQDTAGYNYGAGYDKLSGQYTDALHALDSAGIKARDDAKLGILDSAQTALGNSLSVPISPDTVPMPDVGTAPPAPSQSSPASSRRAARAALGVTDIRRASPATIRRLKRRGLL